MRRQFLEFMKMCNEAGIETDTEMELLLDDQKETTDKGNSSKNVETEQESKDDSRLQGTITSVSKTKHVGFRNEELLVHREAFGKWRDHLK